MEINKIDEKTIEVVETKPEVIIPATESRVLYTIEELDGNIKTHLDNITRFQGYLADTQKEVDKITNDIAREQAEIYKIQAIVDVAVVKLSEEVK